jgi:hypothetical protein
MKQEELTPEEQCEAGARNFLDSIEAVAKHALSSKNKVPLSTGARKDLKWVVGYSDPLHGDIGGIRGAFDQIARLLIDPLKKTRPIEAGYAYEQLWILMSRAVITGMNGGIFPEGVKGFHDHAHGALMRDAKAKLHPEWGAKDRAVEDAFNAHKPKADETKWGLAHSILSEVNKRLERDGLPTINRKQVYGSLCKILPS